ncbi:AMP-binding protein [Brachybacterium phenoliresistens]|uniref:AMP-dependent synthetase n=1 Tax=Brachybacterium phenoliresistens TaxID=396014 RepID=Z9JVZ7_9MICO|nr:AMP-binding protein [Brachybacterium phenoliresistens]EWS81966.1 AMP-dependent synthetase [Brachybacterium phenoliresistens]
MSGAATPAAWLRPAPWDGTAASLAEHVRAIGAVMDGSARLWLGPFAPPARLPEGFEETALVVPTSGSTGTAKAVALSRRALLASQDATAALLGATAAPPAAAEAHGHGFWLPLLPPTHIAGVQVIARAHRTRRLHGLDRPALPQPLPDLSAGFDAELFARLAAPALAQAEEAGLPALTSLVPTQLGRVLADDRATALLSRFAAVLVGGAATAPSLLAAAREAGVAVRTTYGSSETAGGCVYDGVPLPGVELSLADDGTGRLRIRGPMLALGYLRPDGTGDGAGVLHEDAPARPAAPEESAASAEPLPARRVLTTSDLARLDGSRLRILGRADDVIITGGRKVLPQDVESVVLRDPELAPLVRAVVVVGVEDPEWGQRLEALVVPAGAEGDPAALPARIRAVLRGGPLPAHAVPKTVHLVPELPLRGIGKIDRAAAREIAQASSRS